MFYRRDFLRFGLIASLFATLSFPSPLSAFSGDLFIATPDITLSASEILAGQTIRVYATVHSSSTRDIKGVVRFTDGRGGVQIGGDQPISVLANFTDSVFVDWAATVGDHTITASIVPFNEDDDDPANNSAEKFVRVKQDTDRDGIPDERDADDDGDGVSDTEDAFPLDRSESTDTDGDGTGNNADPDDDNDSVLDTDDALPYDANEQIDTDQDGIGNNADADDDGDGIDDITEIAQGIDPQNSDSDGDTVTDGQDIFPTISGESRDYDGDGIGDNADDDDDNDGIPGQEDEDDNNLGPNISLSKPSFFARVGQTSLLTVAGSEDPDGEITGIDWYVNGKKYDHASLKVNPEDLFLANESPGIQDIRVMMTDNRGESREMTLTYRVFGPYFWWKIVLAVIIVVLAMFMIARYTSPVLVPWKRHKKAKKRTS